MVVTSFRITGVELRLLQLPSAVIKARLALGVLVPVLPPEATRYIWLDGEGQS